MLQRTRFFAEHEGIDSTILTFDAFGDYAVVDAALRDAGKLHPDVELHNIYDHYRDRVWEVPTGDLDKLPDLEDLRKVDEYRADGSPWRARYEDPSSQTPLWYDYYRPDGTVYLRTAPLSMDEFPRQSNLVQAVDESGLIRATYGSQGEFFASWVNQDQRRGDQVVLFIDSMMLPPHLSPLLDPSILQVAVLHMAHVYHPRNWNSPQHPPAKRSLEHLHRFDALVVLTERQRQDIELRYGVRSNIFVLPNPAEPATPPDPLPQKDPKRISVIARLERVKRVDHAIRAFARVLQEEPEATLDVYGEGRLRAAHEQIIDELGISKSVTLHGHRPDAPDRLWESSGLLVTSRSEGYPLAPLEALMRGCPVVSYDIKYGPREQVKDGENGYLVPAGNIEKLAQRILDLIRNPADVERMGAQGREQTLADRAAYVDRWAEILDTAQRARKRQVFLDGVTLTVDKISKPRSIWSRILGAVGSTRPDFKFRGRLAVVASGPWNLIDDARLTLDAIDERSGDVAWIPLDVDQKYNGDLELAARTNLRMRVRKFEQSGSRISIRLTLTVRNAYWETLLRDE